MFRKFVLILFLLTIDGPALGLDKDPQQWYREISKASSRRDCTFMRNRIDERRLEITPELAEFIRTNEQDLGRQSDLDLNVSFFTIALTILGNNISLGDCSSIQRSAALPLLLESHTLGGFSVKQLIGRLYLLGIGVIKNETLARSWFRGYALATIHFPDESARAKVYKDSSDNEEVKAALSEAFAWMRGQLAEAPAHHFAVAKMLHDGRRVPRDMESAYFWMSHAADAGLDEAKIELANWVIENRFPWKKRSEEGSALKDAARAGYAPAMKVLAERREVGHGVGKSIYRAYVWFLRARLHGEDVQAAIQRVSRLLNEDERWEARQEAFRDYH